MFGNNDAGVFVAKRENLGNVEKKTMRKLLLLGSHAFSHTSHRVLHRRNIAVSQGELTSDAQSIKT